MKAKKPTPKMSGLVVAALRNLRDAHGSTAKEIMKYIMAEYNASEATVQRQLKTALKRGVEYGILKKTNSGYSLNTEAEVIAPHDSQPVEACKKKKRKACRPKKKKCPKKRKRNACSMKRKCPKKKKKRNPCNTCASRGQRGNCNQQPIQLVHEGSPTNHGDNSEMNENEQDKRSEDEDQEQDQDQDCRILSSRSHSMNRSNTLRNRSRSQSLARSKYSGSDMDEY